ncbi:MAG: hypothetical protein GX434_04540 [Peptococcaceae bacterium]|nr:hypothetical protein [Peptococcaceae bacterium]
MDPEKKVTLLQTFYATVLADSTLQYSQEGILEKKMLLIKVLTIFAYMYIMSLNSMS